MPFDKGLDTGRIYTFTQLLTALTTAPNDLVSLLASSISRVEILAVELCQGTSTPAPATIEMYRGSTGVSAGAAVPAANRDGITAAQPALSSASGFSATQLSTASAQRIHAAAFDSVSGNYK